VLFLLCMWIVEVHVYIREMQVLGLEGGTSVDFRMPGLVGGTLVPFAPTCCMSEALPRISYMSTVVRWSVLCPISLYPAAVRR
jgi:hypothetical protein